MNDRLGPEDPPEALGAAIGEFKPPDVTWHDCSRGCGEKVMRPGPCPSCADKQSAKEKAKEGIEDSIPKAFAWARFDNPLVGAYIVSAHERVGIEEPKAIDSISRARDAIDAERVVLQGSSGKGKTTLAICMMRAWAQKNSARGLFVYAPDLSSARMRTKLGREAEIVLDALATPLLVLDDVGGGNLQAGPLEEVVHKRHHDGKVTWFTTWMLSITLGHRFGGGFARRIFENARVIDMLGAK